LDAEEDERAELLGFLDWFRGVAEHKLGDLSTEESTRVATPTGMSMLGIVKHLSWCEEVWFEHYPARGRPAARRRDRVVRGVPGRPARRGHRHLPAQVRPLPGDHGVGPARHPVGDAARDLRPPDPAWIVLHMIEETARHAGHLDILRELTDGRAGD
jgi:hypothetical protein